MFFFFPVGTDAPLYHRPWGTGVLIAINVLIGIFVMTLSETQVEDLVAPWVLSHGDGLHPLQWVTSIFLHEGLAHLFYNMLFLWVFGLVVEGKVGLLRYLLIYFGIGVCQCAIEQVLFLGAQGGGSLGASSAIYGLMAIALIWAPMNNIEWWYAYFFFRFGDTGTAEVTIRTVALGYIGMDVLDMGLTYQANGEAAGTGMLHLMGAALGLVVGIVMFKLDLVDCEGWDFFNVWKGTTGEASGADDLLHRKPKLKQGKESRAKAQIPIEERHEMAGRQLTRLVEEGELEGALRLMDKAAGQLPDWKPPQRALLRLIARQQEAGRWAESVYPMVRFLRYYDDETGRVRLKLAQVLMRYEQRPAQALRVLEKIPADALRDSLEAARQKLIAEAHRMIDEGTLELETEEW